MNFLKKHKVWFLSGGAILLLYIVYRWYQNRQAQAATTVDPNNAANAAALQAAMNAQGLGAAGAGTVISSTPSPTPQSPAQQTLNGITTPDLASILAATGGGDPGPNQRSPTPIAPGQGGGGQGSVPPSGPQGGLAASDLFALLAALASQPGMTTPPNNVLFTIPTGTVPTGTGTGDTGPGASQPVPVPAQPIRTVPNIRGTFTGRVLPSFPVAVINRRLTSVPQTNQTTPSNFRTRQRGA